MHSVPEDGFQQIQRRLATLVLAFAAVGMSPEALRAEAWSVPLAGNAFRTAPAPGSNGLLRNGNLAWSDADGVFSIFFHVDRPSVLDLSIRGRVPDGRCMFITRVGAQRFETRMEGAQLSSHDIGRIEVRERGYVRIDLQGGERTGDVYAEMRELLVASETAGLALNYVTSNEGNMFYWGRRGPSVHLRYQVPPDREFQYAYSEITVPQGQDPLGSYFMANGFGEGYFGIQVNGPDERRVLFSVWSPFQTNNPRDIPEDQRIATLARGPDVHVGEFGNEGSGGQSYLVYPWKADTTYRFLTEVKPDGKQNTVYTSWFGDKAAGEWRLIASFRRPKTETHLRGFHSFLESFMPTHGHLGRRAHYGNVWVRDVEGEWHECSSARFSVDATGGKQQRLDFTGGSDGSFFLLRNCGFFSETGAPGETFTRASSADQRPEIDFASLPRGG